MFAPVVLMKAFKAGGGAENPSGGVMFVYSILAVLAFCGLVSAALFNRSFFFSLDPVFQTCTYVIYTCMYTVF